MLCILQYARSVDVIRMFLVDGRVDPATSDNYALHLAIMHDHWPLFHLLLTDERVQAIKRRME